MPGRLVALFRPEVQNFDGNCTPSKLLENCKIFIKGPQHSFLLASKVKFRYNLKSKAVLIAVQSWVSIFGEM
jgi:hypothetical protein